MGVCRDCHDMQQKGYGETMHCVVGILDGLFCHLDSLNLNLWQHAISLLQQMLESQHSKAGGLQLVAVVGIGRLLMHAAEVCADLSQTEQLIALLVQTYVQPETPGRGKGCCVYSYRQGLWALSVGCEKLQELGRCLLTCFPCVAYSERS